MQLLFNGLSIAICLTVTVWAIAHLNTRHRLSKTLAQFILILGLILLLMGWWAAPVALAEIQLMKEADQWVYQAQHTLTDTADRTWDVTLLKPMEVGRQGVYLHVVTSDPSIQLNAAPPLTLNTASGQTLSAPNTTRQYFIGSIPDPNVGHYDIQSVVPQLQRERSLQLQLPTQTDEPITIDITADVLEEWLTIGTCDYLICDRA